MPKDESKKDRTWGRIVDNFANDDPDAGDERDYFEALRVLSEKQIRNVMKGLPA